MKPKLILIGNGMASAKLLQELMESCPNQYEIHVFGDDPNGSYNRIMLSPLLAGEKDFSQIQLLSDAWLSQHQIETHLGNEKRVIKIDRGQKKVICQDGSTQSYDRLVIATGSQPSTLPIAGTTLKGVMTFRDKHDVEQMIQASRTQQRAIVIGAGLLGLEAAVGLKQRGMDVTVVHRAAWPLNRQLDQEAGEMLQTHLESLGLAFEMQSNSKAILGENAQVSALELADGRHLPCELLVMALGIQPNIELAKSSGIHCEHGIIVDDTMQTYDPSIYALGECVQHRGDTFGLVAPLYDQAKVLANHLSEHGVASYQTLPTGTKLKVSGIHLFSVGNFQGDENCEYLYYRDKSRGIYKKLVIKEQCLVGALMLGDTRDSQFYKSLIDTRTNISGMRSTLMFGEALCQSVTPEITKNEKAA